MFFKIKNLHLITIKIDINEIINDEKVNINSRVVMMGFLSTLRNSIVLWNE